MQNAAQAYNETAKITENSREREASLLIKAASELQSIRDNWTDDRTAVRRALNFNSKLWTVFVSSVAREENPLPQDVKNNIGSIGVFILGRTAEALVEPAPEKLGPLITINQNIAAGLRGQA